MDRRESIKSLLIGSLGAGAIVSTAGCKPGEETKALVESNQDLYGRTEKEKARDEELMSDIFLNEHEADTIATLCDLILPADGNYQAASAAEVPEFIAFIVKDMEDYQLPLRGGIMWLDNYANEQFGVVFKNCSGDQQRTLLDAIAYPSEDVSDLTPGIEFFSLVRNLTLTGFYTSKIGIEELGYKGNTPNVWEGVPDAVLKKHGFSYDEKIQYVDQSKRNEIAEWDENGNLLT